jgi:pimeloyl-ACP methyl ester carboxylesterase
VNRDASSDAALAGESPDAFTGPGPGPATEPYASGSLQWADWVARAQALDARFDGLFTHQRFRHHQPLALQGSTPARLRRAYDVPVAYLDWRPRRGAEVAIPAAIPPAISAVSSSVPRASPPAIPAAPATLICLGGVANSAARFAFLAADLARAGHRVLAMDWLGRGLSGWLADEREYRLATLVEQLRQFIAHLALPRAPVLLGSSLGGSVGIALSAAHPTLVGGLVLNDVGPHMPRARRQRRARTLARWYVFGSPAEIQRRVGAAQKNDGPLSEEIRHFLAWHQTRWSEADGGRVYRHDPRAMLAYRRDAGHALDQWAEWRRLQTPLLVLHGMESDALRPRDLQRMRALQPALSLAHIPQTGHTPVLCDRHQTALIADWLRGLDEGAPPLPFELSVPLAPPRGRWAADGAS